MAFKYFVGLSVLLFNIYSESGGDEIQDFRLKKIYHEPKPLSSSDITKVARMSNMARFDKILTNILVPRVVGSESHRKVKEYIINELKGLNYTVEMEVSQQKTPIGQLTFTNIIGRLNPRANRYLVLACHYDSKYMREGEFLGATDSAVPCAMMIDLAYSLKDRLDNFKNTDLSLMLLFFDGEEAFEHWGPNDSIYGARSLANTWDRSNYPQPSSPFNHLDRMDLLVLLDLLGAPQPTFYNYFKDTQKWFEQFVSAEERLTEKNLLRKKHNEIYFINIHFPSHVEDDHIPFIQRDVPCVHVITLPFPDVWHTPRDNRNALDMDTIDNLNKILRVFTLEYLEGNTRFPLKTESQPPDL